MLFFKKIFGFSNKRKQSETEEITLLSNKIKESILKCKEENTNAQNQIDYVYKQAKKIILEIFDVPRIFWYEELKNYSKIKSLEQNISINQLLINKCDVIIKEYKEQIEIKKSKIKFNEKLLEKYSEIEGKLLNTAEKIRRKKEEQKQLELLEKHSEIISKMNRKERKNNLQQKKDDLFHLSNDIQAIEDEITFSTELQNRMDIMQNDIDTHGIEGSEFIKNDIDELFKEL